MEQDPITVHDPVRIVAAMEEIEQLIDTLRTAAIERDGATIGDCLARIRQHAATTKITIEVGIDMAWARQLRRERRDAA